MYCLFHRAGIVPVLLSVLLSPLSAQTSAPSDEESEITVVVTAERGERPIGESIASATVVSAKEMREQGAQTVADALRFVPGISIRQSGTPGAASVARSRGTNSNQVLVLLDGQRVSSPAFVGGTDLSKYQVSGISHVEVIRGPVSSLYGSEAIGGVINIVTRQPDGKAGDAVLGYGANGRAERSLSLSGGSDRVSWLLAGSLPAYSGDRPNSSYSASSFSGRVTAPSIRGWRMSLRADTYSDRLGLPGSLQYPSPNDRQWWDRSIMDLTAARDTAGGRLECRLYSTVQKLQEINPDYAVDSNIRGTGSAGEIVYRRESGSHNWIIGGEYRDDGYRDTEAGTLVQHRGTTNRALFAQDRLALNDRASIVLGLRMDDHSTAGSRTTPRAGLTYAMSKGIHLRLSYGEGFRAPSLVELYYNGLYGQGNPSLKPEKSRQLEIGLNMVRGRDSFDAAVFLNKVRDLIEWTVVDPQTWQGTYENVSRARQRGIELSWEHRLSSSGTLALSYTYVDASNLSTGNRLLAVPHNRIALTFARPIGSWNIALSGRWSDDIPDYAGTMVSGRAVYDLTLARRGGKSVNPYAVIRNLLNTSYQEVAGYPAEGRSLELGVRMSW